MVLRIVLCAECWSWIIPDGDHCPECQSRVDLHESDPDAVELDAVLGEPLVRLAAVRLERSRLPSTGTLWGTTTGLLFLPHLQPGPEGSLVAAGGDAGGTLWSRLTRWSPWAGTAVEPWPDDAAASEEADLASWGERFLDAPGAVFCARSTLVRLALRPRLWSCVRIRSRTLQIRPQTPPARWQPAWRQLQQLDRGWLPFVGRL